MGNGATPSPLRSSPPGAPHWGSFAACGPDAALKSGAPPRPKREWRSRSAGVHTGIARKAGETPPADLPHSAGHQENGATPSPIRSSPLGARDWGSFAACGPDAALKSGAPPCPNESGVVGAPVFTPASPAKAGETPPANPPHGAGHQRRSSTSRCGVSRPDRAAKHALQTSATHPRPAAGRDPFRIGARCESAATLPRSVPAGSPIESLRQRSIERPPPLHSPRLRRHPGMS